MGLIPGSGRSPGGGHGNPLQYSCQKNPMDREAWRATVHGGRKESDTTEQVTTSTLSAELGSQPGKPVFGVHPSGHDPWGLLLPDEGGRPYGRFFSIASISVLCSWWEGKGSPDGDKPTALGGGFGVGSEGESRIRGTPIVWCGPLDGCGEPLTKVGEQGVGFKEGGLRTPPWDRNPPTNAGDVGSIPGPGRPHTPQSS